jgi:serine/threonine-protein kinase
VANRRNKPILEQLSAHIGERYRVERELGRGATAIVLLARDLKHDRDVALKVLKPNFATTLGPDRFLREIRVASKLTHPNILGLHDSGNAGGLLYYVTPFVAGKSLRQHLRSDGPLPLERALRIATELCEALAYAHDQHVLHRDIKPENVLLLEGHALLADFGLALALGADRDDRLTSTGIVVGTPRYVSPEQASGSEDLGPASDIYSLACVIFEMFAGAPPFTADDAYGIMRQHISEKPPSLLGRPGVPDSVAHALSGALAKDPAERPAGARELAAALQHVRVEVAPTAALAVLPFENLSQDPDMDFFSDGITEEIMGSIAQIPALRVIGRTSSFSLKGQKLDLDRIGRSLKVGSVVTGSVRRAGERVRISVQLVSTVDGFQLWSERFDRKLGDVFVLQDEIARTVAARLVAHSDSNSLLTPTLAAPPHPAAYDAYLEGRYLHHQYRPESVRRALGCFERAIAQDARFALPWAGIADVHVLLAMGFDLHSSQENLSRAREAARRAVALAPELAEAHLAQAVVALFLEWRFEAAIEAFNRALELKPSFADAHQWCEFLWTYVRRDYHRALEELRCVRELDPLQVSARVRLGTVHYIFGNYEMAHAEFDGVLEEQPGQPLALLGRGDTLLRQGRFSEAVVACSQAVERGGSAVAFRGVLGICYAFAGRQVDAEHILGQLLAEPAPLPAFWIGVVHAALGRIQQSLGWLERAAANRDPNMLYITAVPRIDGLQTHPRYEALLSVMGLRSDAANAN